MDSSLKVKPSLTLSFYGTWKRFEATKLFNQVRHNLAFQYWSGPWNISTRNRRSDHQWRPGEHRWYYIKVEKLISYPSCASYYFLDWPRPVIFREIDWWCAPDRDTHEVPNQRLTTGRGGNGIIVIIDQILMRMSVFPVISAGLIRRGLRFGTVTRESWSRARADACSPVPS